MLSFVPTRALAGAFLALALFATLGISADVAQARAGRSDVIIAFANPPGPDDQAAVRSAGGDIKYTYTIVNAIAASVPDQALDGLSNNPNITAIEPDLAVYAVDAELDNTWGVKRIGAGAVHDGGNRALGVKVAVIDSGIDCSHPDLINRCAGGFDFANNDSDPSDDNGHGTHVAGTIAAEDDDNANSVVGVGPKISLYALKVLKANGSGSYSDVIAALEWAVVNGIQVTNSSFGSSGDPGATVKAAFDNAEAAGIVNVGAAGNGGTCAGNGDSVIYPARWSSVIAVSATDVTDGVACFSSKGPDVELAAPGVNINSTLLGGGYGLKSGTSMASPHVAGASALVIASGITDANGNGRINDDVRLRLQQTAEDLELPSNWTGYGLVDVAAAVVGGGSPPPPPPPGGGTPFDDFESGDLSGGTGWLGPWSSSGDISILGGDGPHSGAFHVQLRAFNGYIQRTADITGQTDVHLKFWSRVRSFEWFSSDRAYVWASPDGISWAVVATFTWIDSDDVYRAYDIDVSAYAGSGSIFIAFDPDMSSSTDYWFIDDVELVGNGPANSSPVADPGPDQAGNEGDGFTFDGSGSFDVDGTITSYDWDFGDGGTASGVSATHVYADDGVYIVTLTVTDDAGADGSDSALVTVANLAPVAGAGGPYTGIEGSAITFSGSVSDPGLNDTHTFTWDFGDGASGTGQSVTHAYADNGSFTVTLTVLDDDGGTGTDVTVATVSNADPVASTGGPYAGETGSLITFSGSVSDPGWNDTHTFAWNFGDGATGTGQTVTHAYATAATYIATLTVTDDDGGVGSASTTVTVSAPNTAPTARAGLDQTGDEGDSFAFDGSGSFDADGTIVSYEWDFGDGETASGITASHIYADNDVYTVTLTVTDDGGSTGSDTALATVANVAPVAAAGGPYAGETGSPITFTGGVSDPGLADTHTFAWDFGDGFSDIGQTVTHAYAIAGPYSATLTVTDDDGGSGSGSTTVTVSASNTAPAVTITSPSGGDTFLTIDSIQFSGSALDPEDGELTVSLIWISNIDGVIGNGGSFSATLQEGSHTITAQVMDAGGATGGDSISITVNSPVVSDTVEIIKAKYEIRKSKLGVEATSTDGGSATLTATAYDADNNVLGSVEMSYSAKKGKYKGEITGLNSKPVKVVVVSSGGGSDTRSGSGITGRG
ncbi:MAG: PKD domain-containing protein [Chloroflexi bacterium]|nr:PKD domain-containing protein [Chloroflexota bacterium]